MSNTRSAICKYVTLTHLESRRKHTGVPTYSHTSQAPVSCHLFKKKIKVLGASRGKKNTGLLYVLKVSRTWAYPSALRLDSAILLQTRCCFVTVLRLSSKQQPCECHVKNGRTSAYPKIDASAALCSYRIPPLHVRVGAPLTDGCRHK